MAENKPTFFQRVNKFLGTDNTMPVDYTRKNITTYNINNPNVLFATKDKSEYESKKLELRQNKLLKWRWKKAGVQISNQQYMNLSDVKMMYRDADLMDGFPELGACLDIISEETCFTPTNGFMVNVNSKSERIKSILQDLLVNRLQIQMTLPMICRSTVKYGNSFMLLNIDVNNGVQGWQQLPVYEVERYENMTDDNPYHGYFQNPNNTDIDKDGKTRFVWVGQNDFTPYWNWQIAHFRLLYDSMYLPYGVSYLNKARRHWRMLSMMEDAMLMYRLERAVERRVFKVNVGAINEDDVPAYVEEVANEFKRTPVVDPLTGQLDLRKNVMPIWKNTPIPLLDGRIITIEELAKEYENGKVNYVHSIQDKTQQIVPGKVAWCGKNYTAKQMIKVTLDDGGYVVLAPEHEFIMRDGSKKRADKVCVGESVMPFYTEYEAFKKGKNNTYLKVFNPNSGKYEFMHRMVGACLEKPSEKDEKITTIHHINFNRYDNTPENLKWCGWHEHAHMHSELATKNNIERWNNPEIRENWIKSIDVYNKSDLHKQHNQIRSKLKKEFWKTKNAEIAKRNMTIIFDDYVWNKIENAIFNGIVYDRSSMLAYINNIIISHILEINSNKRLRKSKSISRTVLQERIHSIGFNTITEYIEDVHNRIGGVDPSLTVHNKKAANMNKFNRGNRKVYVVFDDNIYAAMRLQAEGHSINSVSSMTRYLNENMINYIREINNLDENYTIDVDTVTRRILSLGFNNTTEYFEAMQKNHKISKIEYIEGDDVYCMTVVGLNGEDDRHNFALLTLGKEQKEHEKMDGCFVSNCQSEDFFIPVRDPSDPNPIETLPAAQNLTALDDIKYVQNKICAALRVPKSFLNFEETAGDGKNLSLMDVRFMRTVNRIQQTMLLELNKICIIHLAFLGFTDDLTNFTLTMNNPSSQAEMLELENLAKKITTAKDAITDNGNGIPLFSCTRAWKEILGWSEKEIADNLEELRLETALGAELQKTNQIIKRTHLFDKIDNIYGEPGTEYSEGGGGEEGGDEGMGGGGGGGLGGFGGDMDMGGEPEGEDMGGAEGDMSMDQAAAEEGGDMGGAPEGGEPLAEMVLNHKLKQVLLREDALRKDYIAKSKKYSDMLLEKINEKKKKEDEMIQNIPLFNKTFFVNEELDSMSKNLDNYIKSNPSKLHD